VLIDGTLDTIPECVSHVSRVKSPGLETEDRLFPEAVPVTVNNTESA
jgi:hypothetical protein